jgi:hypothetical protein
VDAGRRPLEESSRAGLNAMWVSDPSMLGQVMTTPPSMATVCPVMLAARSESGKAPSLRCRRGSRGPHRNHLPDEPGEELLGSGVGVGGIVRDQPLAGAPPHIGPDQARHHRVGPQPRRRPDPGDHVGQFDDRGLRRAVVGEHLHAQPGADRGDVDDRTGATGAAADELLARQERPAGINRERVVPLLLGQLGERAEPPDPGDIRQRGHLAELLLGGGERGLHGRSLAHVAASVVESARSANNRVPACDTTPAPSAVTVSLGRVVVALHLERFTSGIKLVSASQVSPGQETLSLIWRLDTPQPYEEAWPVGTRAAR